MIVCCSVGKFWKLKVKNFEKPIITYSTKYTRKKYKQTIPVNDNVKDIKNDELVSFIMKYIMNDNYIYLNKEGNHTLENDIYVMTLLWLLKERRRLMLMRNIYKK